MPMDEISEALRHDDAPPTDTPKWLSRDDALAVEQPRVGPTQIRGGDVVVMLAIHARPPGRVRDMKVTRDSFSQGTGTDLSVGVLTLEGAVSREAGHEWPAAA